MTLRFEMFELGRIDLYCTSVQKKSTALIQTLLK